jgi:hypothetical protein
MQAMLEQIEHEDNSEREPAPDTDEQREAKRDREARRAAIFAAAHATGVRTWQGESTDVVDPLACRVRLRYCEHCLEELRGRIAALAGRTALRDPFGILESKFGLTDDELEVLIFLYFRQFEQPRPINGAELLGAVIGRQHAVYRGQSILFDASKLLANGLLAVVERGSGTFDTTFALSRTANLIISGLHVDYPLQDVKWTVTRRPPVAAGDDPGTGWNDTVIYAGADAARAVELALWCFGAGKQLHVVRTGFPDLVVVPCFAVVVEPEFMSRAEWGEYMEYRDEVSVDDPGNEYSEAVVVAAADRSLAEITAELDELAAANTRQAEVRPE